MSVLFLKKKLMDRFGFLSDASAGVVLDSFMDELKNSLSQAGRIELKGFGSFFVKSRAGYVVYNPICKRDINIAERKVIHFRASNLLLDYLEKKDGVDAAAGAVESAGE